MGVGCTAPGARIENLEDAFSMTTSHWIGIVGIRIISRLTARNVERPSGIGAKDTIDRVDDDRLAWIDSLLLTVKLWRRRRFRGGRRRRDPGHGVGIRLKTIRECHPFAKRRGKRQDGKQRHHRYHCHEKLDDKRARSLTARR